MTTYEQQEPGDAVRPIKAGPFFASDAEAARSVADRWGKAVPAALTRADLDDALLGVAARLDRLDVRELNLAPERMLLREAVDRIAGCAGDPCCAACGDWAARVRLVLGTDDLGVEGAASGGGVGIEGARVIEAARRLADCSAFDVVDEMDGLRAALAALDAPPIHQERHQPPSGGDPASQGGVPAWTRWSGAWRRLRGCRTSGWSRWRRRSRRRNGLRCGSDWRVWSAAWGCWSLRGMISTSATGPNSRRTWPPSRCASRCWSRLGTGGSTPVGGRLIVPELKIELGEKQHAALVMRSVNAGAPSPEAYLAMLPMIHGEAEAKSNERLEVYEEAYQVLVAVATTLARSVVHDAGGLEQAAERIDGVLRRELREGEREDVIALMNGIEQYATRYLQIEATERKGEVIAALRAHGLMMGDA